MEAPRAPRVRPSLQRTSRHATCGAISRCTQQPREWSVGCAQSCSASESQKASKNSDTRIRGSGGTPPKTKIPLVAERIPLDVLFEDEHILVVNKPAGVKHEPVHRFAGGSLLNRVVGYLGFEPFTVHRLDMFTSGVVCLAKHVEAAKRLHALFRQSTQRESESGAPPAHAWSSNDHAYGVHKRYVALAVGTAKTTSFTVDAPIARHPHHKFARVVPEHPEHGARALTFFYVVAYNSQTRAVLLECLPQSGRTHQIRVHLQHFGLPILGDHLYGENSLLLSASDDYLRTPCDSGTLTRQGRLQGDDRSGANDAASGESWKRSSILGFGPPSEIISHQALHALSLTIVHPYSKENQTFTCSIPRDMQKAAEVLHLPLPVLYVQP